MDNIKRMIAVHILFTLLLLQIAHGITLIHNFGFMPYGIAIIVPSAFSFYLFIKEFGGKEWVYFQE